MEVIIKDDVEVSKKGELTMDVDDKSIWEVSEFSIFPYKNLTQTLQKMKNLCQDLQITRLVGKPSLTFLISCSLLTVG